METGGFSDIKGKTFNNVKNAFRKTLHTLVDLDFEDGKLDNAIKMFLDAKKMQINFTFNLNPNDVIFISNLHNETISPKTLDRIKRLRRGQQ